MATAISSDSKPPRGGIGFLGALCLVFIGLKLTGFIDWSWWLVLSPLWVSWVLVIVFLSIALLIVAFRRE